MNYNVYRIESQTLLGAFSTQAAAQNFINTLTYNDVGLSIVYQ